MNHEQGCVRRGKKKIDSFLAIDDPDSTILDFFSKSIKAWAHLPNATFDHDPVSVSIIMKAKNREVKKEL